MPRETGLRCVPEIGTARSFVESLFRVKSHDLHLSRLRGPRGTAARPLEFDRKKSAHAYRYRSGVPPRGLSPERLSHSAHRTDFPPFPRQHHRRLRAYDRATAGRREECAADPQRRRPPSETHRSRRKGADGRRLPGDAGSARHPEAAIGPNLPAGAGDRNRALGQPGPDGAVPDQRRLLHAMRGGGFSPHHLFPRPSGHSLGLHGPHRGAEKRSAAAALQRQPPGSRRPAPAAGTMPSGTIRSRNPPISLRWSPAISARSRTVSSPHPGARSNSASMSSTARKGSLPTRWTR